MVLHVLQVVVGRQIQRVRGRDVIIDKLVTVLNNTKALIGIILLARFYVDEVLLDVSGLFCELFCLF